MTTPFPPIDDDNDKSVVTYDPVRTRQFIAKSIQNDIYRLYKRLLELPLIPIDAILAEFPLANFQLHWTQCHFEAELPLDFALVAKFKAFMGRKFEKEWKLINDVQHVWSAKNAGRFLTYANSAPVYLSFDVSFRSSRSGTTCVIQKVGKVAKTEEVYELVCADGAAEPLFPNDPAPDAAQTASTPS